MEAVAGTGCRVEIVGELSEELKTSRGKISHGLKKMDTDSFSGGFPAEKSGFPRKAGILKPTDLKLKQSEKTEDGGQETVKVLGRLTDEELVQAYRSCDMVVFASLYEGFGLPILEAQAMGRPVITSNFGAMREAAGDGALLVDPYSVEAIREAVLRIKREPALREDLIAKGRENAERFRAEAVAARYAELYRNVATADRRETDSSKS